MLLADLWWSIHASPHRPLSSWEKYLQVEYALSGQANGRYRLAQFLVKHGWPRGDAIRQVIVITHELSPIKNESHHLGDIYSPCPVHFVMGRSAAAHPVCPPQHCLYYTWKDWSDLTEVIGTWTKHVVSQPLMLCPRKQLFSESTAEGRSQNQSQLSTQHLWVLPTRRWPHEV
jgi:hypothetical protein